MREYLCTFSGMPGVKRKTLRGPNIRSVYAANSALKKYRIISASGDNGAVNIYKDDDCKWRAVRFRYLSEQDAQTYKTKTEALAWLKTALLKIK